jgi:hypothetical protein
MRSLTFLLFASFALLFLPGCSSSSPQAIENKALLLSSQFLSLLQQIDSRDSLISHKDEISLYYSEFANLIIDFESLANSDSDLPSTKTPPRPICKSLQLELARIYKIEGGREFMEDCQEDAIYKLTTFERKSGKSIR